MEHISREPVFASSHPTIDMDHLRSSASRPQHRPFAVALKRFADVVLALIFLFLSFPVLVIIACAIKVESRGPILFKQRRYGRDTCVFEIFKFRTMHVGFSDPEASVQSRQGDPRFTRVGALIRRHSLDEVPQLLNVVRGEMSLVGPRPHALGTSVGGVRLRELIQNYDSRYCVRPGLTGLAQISGFRGELSTEAKAYGRLRFDLEYIDTWSLWLDFKIMLATVRCIFGDEDAY